MEEIVKSLASPGWWFTAVLMSLLMSLIAGWLKPPLDFRLSKTSRWWRVRSEARRREFDKYVKRLISTQHQQVMLSGKITQDQISTLTWAVLAWSGLAGMQRYDAQQLLDITTIGYVTAGTRTMWWLEAYFVGTSAIMIVVKGSVGIHRGRVLKTALRLSAAQKQRRSGGDESVNPLPVPSQNQPIPSSDPSSAQPESETGKQE